MRRNYYILIIFILCSIFIFIKPTATDFKYGVTDSASKILATISEENLVEKRSLPKINYSKSISEVLSYKEGAKNLNKDSVRNFLFDKLSTKVFPAWYGTDWDYSGTTEIPRNGSIACGYLVSTIMKHIGFNLNRYKLARQTASNIIKSTCLSSSVKHYKSIFQMNNALKKNKGIYIIGLNYHVGFLLADGQNLWFFHSDYFTDEVLKEDVLKSYNLKTSNTLMVGDFLGNDKILHKWIHSEPIKIST